MNYQELLKLIPSYELFPSDERRERERFMMTVFRECVFDGSGPMSFSNLTRELVTAAATLRGEHWAGHAPLERVKEQAIVAFMNWRLPAQGVDDIKREAERERCLELSLVYFGRNQLERLERKLEEPDCSAVEQESEAPVDEVQF